MIGQLMKAVGLNTNTVYCELTKYCGGTKMPTLTVSIPDNVKKMMDAHPEINWSAYLKERIKLRIAQLRKFEELVDRGLI